MQEERSNTKAVPDEDFNDAEADLVLLSTSTGTTMWDSPSNSFKVKGATLAAVSPVFRDMFERTSHDGSKEEKVDGLPLLQLPESSPVLRLILAAVYNRADLLTLDENTDWHLILAVWEAASKYEMFVVRSYAHMALMLQASKLGPQDAVKVYTRASLIGDKVLAAAFLHKAAQSPQMRLEVSTLRELPSEALLKLLTTRDSAIKSKTATIQELSFAKRGRDGSADESLPQLKKRMNTVNEHLAELRRNYFT
ncbi:hypothetical protein P389DRAFT_196675 [Cystobasidium minutum MCA 4210]|uniref:uncharacterized protein n=1 Tax=Cystobasidium minutum MCA 4210 TaxID=1397322 RepID=UPI0034CEAB90|eukprot:jgi/Rhomi1/196675/gm1.4889_g